MAWNLGGPEATTCLSEHCVQGGTSVFFGVTDGGARCGREHQPRHGEHQLVNSTLPPQSLLCPCIFTWWFACFFGVNVTVNQCEFGHAHERQIGDCCNGSPAQDMSGGRKQCCIHLVAELVSSLCLCFVLWSEDLAQSRLEP